MVRSIMIPLLVLLNYQNLETSAQSISLEYDVVFPQILHSVYKEHGKDQYPSLIQYELNLKGKLLVIHLEKSENLISDNYIETRYLQDDIPVMTASKDQIQDHCHYQGYVKGDEESLVSISTCSGLSGVILTHGHKFLIEPLNPSDNGEHAVYKAQMDIPKTSSVKSPEDTHKNMSTETDQGKEDDFLNSQKYIELYMVADKSMFEAYGRNVSRVKNKIFEIVNSANLMFKFLKIFVALTGVEIWETKDQITINPKPSENLDLFAKWRKEILLPRVEHDNAQLITQTDFEGTAVGLAFSNTMCAGAFSVGIIQDYSRFATLVGFTLTHEMGHSLGMKHDENNCSCPLGTCVMAAQFGSKFPGHFSNCSLSQFKTFIENQQPKCMINKPERKNIVAPSVCGNQFTELGEDCDCGTVQECANPCCNATTCKLHAGAKCAEGECCERCQIRKNGTVCRVSGSEDCDNRSICDGSSNICPSNRLKDNGVPCKGGQGYCYNGQCPTHINQCISLWGPASEVGRDICYNANNLGTNYGHCSQFNNTYVACDKKDVICGVLFCSSGNDTPTVKGSVASFSRCKAVLDPIGMVQNGTKCGDKRICYNAKCLSTNDVYAIKNK